MRFDKRLLICDVVLVAIALYFSLMLRFDFGISTGVGEYMLFFKLSIIPLIVITILFNALFKLYDRVWKYASMEELVSIVYSISLSSIAFIIYSFFVNYRLFETHYYRFPFTVHIIYWVIAVVFLGGIRFFIKYFELRKNTSENNGVEKQNLLIIGAGDASAVLIREIKSNVYFNYNIVGLIDDEPSKKGKLINGIKILGGREQIERICRTRDIDEIILAIPSAEQNEKKAIIEICKKTRCRLKTLPGIYEMIDGKVNPSQIRDVNIEDLLGREQINLNNDNIIKYVKGKTILVTGGGGSIGSELCRQLARFKPKKLLILDIYENNAYELEMELNRTNPELDKEVIIASIREYDRLSEVFETYKPDVVFHAAAHKHVPLMEMNPAEAIKNNVLGTHNVVKCSHEFKVKRFVMISTDKAVNPTNIMGATKRFCEMIIQAYDKISDTEYVAVRFGNVLGSNGSVIPLFKKQIASGGPVTVTDPRITRFFMTIPEAAQLVIQAGGIAKGGEIFVLDMGKPVKIDDLAKDLIKLSGYKVGEDMKIEYTGLRPGEKLYEELLMSEVCLTSTEYEKIFIEKPMDISIEFIQKSIDEFKAVVDKEKEEIFKLIQEKVPTYQRKS